uniref:Uncharacterized protein n=1 Tax=Cacopsylla melanoneura TaxID=428564 RepID=A0A8D8WB22_9HEMI
MRKDSLNRVITSDQCVNIITLHYIFIIVLLNRSTLSEAPPPNSVPYTKQLSERSLNNVTHLVPDTLCFMTLWLKGRENRERGRESWVFGIIFISDEAKKVYYFFLFIYFLKSNIIG